MNARYDKSIVIMGVAGCGKSSLGAALAARLGLPFIEGDDHHSPANREKMRNGVALTDADRAGWLATLAGLLRDHDHARDDSMLLGNALHDIPHYDNPRHDNTETENKIRATHAVVLTCSALRRAYRDQLRAASPDVRFIYPDITPALARERVATRPAHFFSATLVASQFATLEPPCDEPNVLRVNAALPLPQLVDEIAAWAAHPDPHQSAGLPTKSQSNKTEAA